MEVAMRVIYARRYLSANFLDKGSGHKEVIVEE